MDAWKKSIQHQEKQFLSEPILFLILTLIFIFTPDLYIGKKNWLSVYLVCNNRYGHRPWKTHIGPWKTHIGRPLGCDFKYSLEC